MLQVARAERRIGTGHERSRESSIDLFRFVIAGIGYALPLSLIAAVLEPSRVMAHRADSSDAWIGEIMGPAHPVPVLDGRAAFGSAPSARTATGARLVMLHGDQPFAILVDEVRSSVNVETSQILPLPWTCGSPQRLRVRSIVWIEGDEVDLVVDDHALREMFLSGDDPRVQRGQAWTDRITHSVSDMFDFMHMREIIEVRLGDDGSRWALPLACLRHVAHLREPLPLPGSHHLVLGLLSWQKHPIPLIDTRGWYGLSEPNPHGVIAVLKRPDPDAYDDIPIAALRLHQVVGIHAVRHRDGTIVTITDGSCLTLLDLPQMLAEIAT